MMIRAGSFSRIDDFESCKKRAELKYVHKIPEPDRGPPPNGKEWANDRGSRIHDEAERYVKGEADTIPIEAKDFATELQRAREFYANEDAVTEEMWCYTDSWEACDSRDFANTVFRIKTDLTVFRSEVELTIVDYKTGRRFGNEAKHAQQLILYAVGAALLYPAVEHIITELWYFDQNELVDMQFTREQALRFLKGWNDRNRTMLECTEFPANPSKQTCKWCPYGPRGTGHCAQGV